MSVSGSRTAVFAAEENWPEIASMFFRPVKAPNCSYQSVQWSPRHRSRGPRSQERAGILQPASSRPDVRKTPPPGCTALLIIVHETSALESIPRKRFVKLKPLFKTNYLGASRILIQSMDYGTIGLSAEAACRQRMRKCLQKWFLETEELPILQHQSNRRVGCFGRI